MSWTNAGAAAAWVDTVEAFGSRKLSVADVLQPAIRLATEGYKHYMFLSPLTCLIIMEFRVPISEIHSVMVRIDTIKLARQTLLTRNHELERSGDVRRTF